MIFNRGRGRRADEPAGTEPEAQAPEPAEADAEAEDLTGPYDVADAPAGERLDLGSLQIPAVDGVEIRLEADPEGVVAQVRCVHGRSGLQLAVRAAPRGEGIWDEARAEIRRSLEGDGARVEEIEGRYGPELKARIRTPGGPATVRVVGVDGPRWMVQAIYQGPAATDPRAAEPLDACLAGLVVDRGREAMPVHELLPLRLPREMLAQNEARQPGVDGAPGPA